LNFKCVVQHTSVPLVIFSRHAVPHFLAGCTCVCHLIPRLRIIGRTIAQAVSRWLPTAAVRGSKPDLGMWDLWWNKVVLGRFSPSTSVSPAIVVHSTNYSTVTLIYHPGKMYNRPMCGHSTGTYTNLGDLQRDLRGLSPTPQKKGLRIKPLPPFAYVGYT
jgi:hypothetical protein